MLRPVAGAIRVRPSALSAALVALGLIAAGCNSRLLRPPATVFLDGGEQRIDATVGEVPPSFNATYLQFFPNQIALHARDIVRFEVRFNGEPHTVTLGTLVDEAVAAIGRLGPTTDLSAVEALPEMQRLPSIFPNPAPGTPKLNLAAAEACVLERGREPGSGRCSTSDRPAFDGTQALYSSGYLREGDSFRVTLDAQIRPGTYAYMCLVHRAAMTGALQVRSPAEDRPPVVVVKQTAAEQFRNLVATLTAVANEAAQPPDGIVLAGAGPEGLARAYLTAFSPRDARAAASRPLTWRVFGTHTITFNPTRDAEQGLLRKEPDGTVALNEHAWEPKGSADPPAEARRWPTPPNAAAVVVDGGVWDGEGFRSSGVFRASAANAVTYTLAISKPGRYEYRCLVHTTMAGTIVVE